MTQGRPRRVDLAQVTKPDGTTRWVGCVVSSGFDSRVALRAAALRVPLGPLAYAVCALAELRNDAMASVYPELDPRRTHIVLVEMSDKVLAPFAPHLAEELWQQLGCTESLTYATWPSYDPALAKDDQVTVAVQVLGKTRGSVEVEPGAAQATVEELVLALPSVKAHLEGKTIKKVIFVKDKIINFVVA